MSKIVNIAVRVVYDGRGIPTPEVELQTTCGLYRASAPTQQSFSRYDCVEIRDGDKNWCGRGVQKCIDQIRQKLRPALTGLDVANFVEFDKKIKELDESTDSRMSTIGINASLPLSMTCFQAAAAYFRSPLFKFFAQQLGVKPKIPTLAISLVSGGLVSGPSPIKEYCMVSKCDINTQINNYLAVVTEAKKQLKQFTLSQTGGFVLDVDSVDEVLKIIQGWIKSAGLDGKVQLVLDCAATDFFDQKEYKYEMSKFSQKQKSFLSGQQLTDKYLQYIQQNGVCGFVDPFFIEDFGCYADLMQKAKKTAIIGCQQMSTSAPRVQYMLKHERGQLANQVGLQLTQNGLISETVKAAKKGLELNAQLSLITCVGEQEDAFAAHAAVGMGCEYFFVGGLQKGERFEKVNEVVRIASVMK